MHSEYELQPNDINIISRLSADLLLHRENIGPECAIDMATDWIKRMRILELAVSAVAEAHEATKQ